MAIIRHFATSLRAWARKDSSFTRYFPSKASRNLRYVLSQNIPEPGGSAPGTSFLQFQWLCGPKNLRRDTNNSGIMDAVTQFYGIPDFTGYPNYRDDGFLTFCW